MEHLIESLKSEGSEAEFDFIIIGTGLSECILSAALARAGKKVLHTDRNEYYGGTEAVLSFTEWNQYHSNSSSDNNKDKKNEKEDDNKDTEQSNTAAATKDDKGMQGTLLSDLSSDIKSSPLCFQTLSNSNNNNDVADKDEFINLNKRSRQFNICFTTRFVLCRGVTVDTLVHSGVARYIEFRSLTTSYVWWDEGNQSSQKPVLRVPCSKSEVFKSKALTRMEKLQLMKFLQYCMDQSAKDVTKKNEQVLLQGRSLSRPQNKKQEQSFSLASASSSASSSQNELSFSQFLSETSKLSSKLQSVIAYTVALLSSSESVNNISIAKGMERVQRYLNGLGRYGTTPYLCPLYGLCEIAQAFVRLSSVYGGVFILGEKATSLLLHSDSNNENEKKIIVEYNQKQRIRANHVVIGAESITNEMIEKIHKTRKIKHKEVHLVVITHEPLLIMSETHQTDDSSTAEEEESSSSSEKASKTSNEESLLIIPPNTIIGHPYAIHASQLGPSCGITPAGYFTIHFTSAIEINGEKNNEKESLDNCVAAMKKALSVIASNGTLPVLHEVVYSRDLLTDDDAGLLKEQLFGKDLQNSHQITLLGNVTDTKAAPIEILVADHILRAKRLFEEFCPDEDFLPPSLTEQQQREEEQEKLTADLDMFSQS